MNNSIRKIIVIIAAIGLGTFCARSQSFIRKIEQRTFVPKGQWIVGNSVSYSEYSGKNYQFLVVEGFSGKGYTFKISPVLCYAFNDNMAAGGRFEYQRSLNRLNNVDIVINDDTDFSVSDFYQLTHSYSGMAVLRNYINLGDNKRFGLFNESRLIVGGSQSKLVSGTGEELSGTFEKTTNIKIGVSPGFVAFINNYTAVELSIGVLGFSYSRVNQITDQVQVGERTTSRANFKINIFSIGLGIAFYI